MADLLNIDPAVVSKQIAENGDIERLEPLVTASDTNIALFFYQRGEDVSGLSSRVCVMVIIDCTIP